MSAVEPNVVVFLEGTADAVLRCGARVYTSGRLGKTELEMRRGGERDGALDGAAKRIEIARSWS